MSLVFGRQAHVSRSVEIGTGRCHEGYFLSSCDKQIVSFLKQKVAAQNWQRVNSFTVLLPILHWMSCSTAFLASSNAPLPRYFLAVHIVQGVFKRAFVQDEEEMTKTLSFVCFTMKPCCCTMHPSVFLKLRSLMMSAVQYLFDKAWAVFHHGSVVSSGNILNESWLRWRPFDKN